MIENLSLPTVLQSWPERVGKTTASVQRWASTGFSGAIVWRVVDGRETFCLRRWPIIPSFAPRLERIHRTLLAAQREGVSGLPVPVSTRDGQSFVSCDGHLWELAPWLPGEPVVGVPSPTRLAATMEKLAHFHLAAAMAPWSDRARDVSPGILERRDLLASLLREGEPRLRAAIRPAIWPELAQRANFLISGFSRHAPQVAGELELASRWLVPLQPCIRDIWRDHVLFTGDEVTGLIDFGAMKEENVAADLARLLGSLVGDDAASREAALASYQRIRPLSNDERALVSIFDRSGLLLSGMNWLRWVFVEERRFEHPARILARVDEMVARLHLWGSGGVATIPPLFSR